MLTPALKVFWNPRPALFLLEYNFGRFTVHLPLGKRVDERVLPVPFVGGQFGFGEQAMVEHRDKSFPVHAAADKHNLLAAVTVAILPDAFNMTTVLGPVLADGSGCARDSDRSPTWYLEVSSIAAAMASSVTGTP